MAGGRVSGGDRNCAVVKRHVPGCREDSETLELKGNADHMLLQRQRRPWLERETAQSVVGCAWLWSRAVPGRCSTSSSCPKLATGEGRHRIAGMPRAGWTEDCSASRRRRPSRGDGPRLGGPVPVACTPQGSRAPAAGANVLLWGNDAVARNPSTPNLEPTCPSVSITSCSSRIAPIRQRGTACNLACQRDDIHGGAAGVAEIGADPRVECAGLGWQSVQDRGRKRIVN